MNTKFETRIKSEVEVHVVPIDDIIDHDCDDRCICGPTEELCVENGQYEGSVIMHPSLDGREVAHA